MDFLRYLKGSINFDLCFDKRTNSDCKIVGYSDSDFVGNLNRRRSLTGYVFTLSGCAINWKATLQSIVTLSTTETVKEDIWLRGLVENLGLH